MSRDYLPTRLRVQVGLLAVLLVGCQTAPGGVALLPGPRAGDLKFSSYQPAEPFGQSSAGLLSRKAFAASSGLGYRVEVSDLLVGPRQSSAAITFAGAAVVEVRSGSPIVADLSGKRELRPGASVSIAERQPFQVTNRSDTPVTMRVHVFVAE